MDFTDLFKLNFLQYKNKIYNVCACVVWVEVRGVGGGGGGRCMHVQVSCIALFIYVNLKVLM